MHCAIPSVALLCALPLASAAQIENAHGLKPFFRALAQAQKGARAVHVLQYGDSHTASDDWVDTMRKSFQADWGNGGPGFVAAGHPFTGYRRFDVRGANSAGWITQGTVGKTGDERNGLAGVSLTANRPAETITLTTSVDRLRVVFLKQPGGGNFRIDCEGSFISTVNTDGPLETGFFPISTTPGAHTYTITTKSYAPVRIFGWFADNSTGITWETLGINGAQIRMLNAWDRQLWSQQIQARDPALVVLAYGTNEALYPLFTPESYRAELLTAVSAIKRAVPHAAILLVGPPDCDPNRPFPHLQQVIRIQTEIARQCKCAFFDWAKFMDQSGGRAHWVRAGLSQPDRTHLTPEGYQLLGRTLAQELKLEFSAGSSPM